MMMWQGDRTAACLDHFHDVFAAGCADPSVLPQQLHRRSLIQQFRHRADATCPGAGSWTLRDELEQTRLTASLSCQR
jgi:hypothetical protein